MTLKIGLTKSLIKNIKIKIIKKLKVIQIIDSLAVGGAEMMSINIANALVNVGVDSHICATRKEGDLQSNLNTQVKYLFLNKKSTFDFVAVFRLKKYIKTHKIEIIHAHSSSYFIASLVKILYPKVKLIWHDHYGLSEHLNQRKTQPLKFFSKSFLVILSVNNLLKKWAQDNLQTATVIYLPNFASLSNTISKTKLNGIKDKKIVCVAGFRTQKDHVTLLKAFKIVYDIHQDWTLHLIGNHYDDVYYQDIKRFIQANDLSNSVFLYHNATDIKNILAQAAIGVLSSISEGLPVSLLEYSLAGLPVVVTNVGECDTVLENGKYGLLVQPSNEKELAEKISKLINDPTLRNKIALKFKKHIIESYSKEKIIHKLLKIYNY